MWITALKSPRTIQTAPNLSHLRKRTATSTDFTVAVIGISPWYQVSITRGMLLSLHLNSMNFGRLQMLMFPILNCFKWCHRYFLCVTILPLRCPRRSRIFCKALWLTNNEGHYAEPLLKMIYLEFSRSSERWIKRYCFIKTKWIQFSVLESHLTWLAIN